MHKSFLVSLILLSAVLYYSCDDSGTLPIVQPSGLISFTQKNLKPLDQNSDGIYQLWLYIDSAAPSWVSLGRFNINGSGNIVSESGGDMTFGLGADTGRLTRITKCIVSIENPGMNNPFPNTPHIIASTIETSNFYIDSITSNLNMGNENALGAAGRVMSEPFGRGLYYQLSPSTNNADCLKGIWLCDTNYVPTMPDTLNLSANSGFFYKMWIINNVTSELYNLGTFLSVNAPDNDGAGACAGPQPGLNVPGQDFIQTTGGCPAITSLSDGHYGVFITLEPTGRLSYAQPFYLRPYYQSLILVGCGREDALFKQYYTMPTAHIRITRAR